ncbi:hypothetical protein T459_16525 [Capsicum annuum]|uniref:Uncharacterized protein n=1 Tax=Capsicum annuum TaxID=4072 RepID=A0A2G2Z8Y4_CAPAN|nr:hypothetical protein T459_16525 [Capsicum annuum]
MNSVPPNLKYHFSFKLLKFWLSVVLSFFGNGLIEMVDSPVGSNLYVCSIFHKSFIEVNEKGTQIVTANAGVVKLLRIHACY